MIQEQHDSTSCRVASTGAEEVVANLLNNRIIRLTCLRAVVCPMLTQLCQGAQGNQGKGCLTCSSYDSRVGVIKTLADQKGHVALMHCMMPHLLPGGHGCLQSIFCICNRGAATTSVHMLEVGICTAGWHLRALMRPDPHRVRRQVHTVMHT